MSRKATAVKCAAMLLCLSALTTLLSNKQVASEQVRNSPVTVPKQLAPKQIMAAEQPVTHIPIDGPLASRKAEISGLAWYEEHLILLPQYPNRFGNHIFTLAKTDILAFLEGDLTDSLSPTPLSPTPIAFDSSAISEQIEGFEGFEAIAFTGNRAFLAIESSGQSGMKGRIVSAILAPDLSQLVIEAGTKAEILSQSGLANMAEETLVLTEDRVVAIHEANGSQVVAAPTTTAFALTLSGPAFVEAFPQVEYRITDATALDEQRRFWAINYFYEGDRALRPNRDPLITRYGRGETHRQQSTVERLVEFQYTDQGIFLADTPPIQLQLASEGRNWEGVTRLDNRGFLLATDKFPETILGFVERPRDNR